METLLSIGIELSRNSDSEILPCHRNGSYVELLS